eukprot:CAMPEP_0119144320 /NCGR_PEP_ID=MMETSP1310-20130426/35692_1 /TAXON_ID=464262 /ORGANISM="Genus nov. species nov., Strain RCC2339" /LENGTH=227 /DNA_ID=CAMNT_0007136049 /DNA_START=101 /DNA_END=781 /DNA_ORIENTATION=-
MARGGRRLANVAWQCQDDSCECCAPLRGLPPLSRERPRLPFGVHDALESALERLEPGDEILILFASAGQRVREVDELQSELGLLRGVRLPFVQEEHAGAVEMELALLVEPPLEVLQHGEGPSLPAEDVPLVQPAPVAGERPQSVLHAPRREVPFTPVLGSPEVGRVRRLVHLHPANLEPHLRAGGGVVFGSALFNVSRVRPFVPRLVPHLDVHDARACVAGRHVFQL